MFALSLLVAGALASASGACLVAAKRAGDRQIFLSWAKSFRLVIRRLRLSHVGKVSLPRSRATYVTAMRSISTTFRTWFVSVA
jgi:hypothetical protein